jgi:BlaR1 peptidase M56
LSWLWLFTLGETLLFFHPLVWLARREWAVATESACDQLALRITKREPHDYGSMLIGVVAQMTTSRPPLATASVGMFETATSLKRRLKAMTKNQSRLSTAFGMALVGLLALALVPCQLVAETPDAETLARLKEENAKLKQQLEATRAEIEALRQETMAAKERDKALEQKERGLEDFPRSPDRHAELADRLRRAHAELDALLKRYTDRHPDVLAKQRQVQRLQEQLSESSRHLDLAARAGRAESFVPATAEQVERSREHRELLAREIELAEQQVEVVRKKLENGKEIAENLMRVQREVLDLKLKQAELSGSKAEQRAVLLQQLQIAQRLLKEQKKRIEVGTLPPGEELAFEREVLRLRRELAGRE